MGVISAKQKPARFPASSATQLPAASSWDCCLPNPDFGTETKLGRDGRAGMRSHISVGQSYWESEDTWHRRLCRQTVVPKIWDNRFRVVSH